MFSGFSIGSTSEPAGGTSNGDHFLLDQFLNQDANFLDHPLYLPTQPGSYECGSADGVSTKVRESFTGTR